MEESGRFSLICRYIFDVCLFVFLFFIFVSFKKELIEGGNRLNDLIQDYRQYEQTKIENNDENNV